MPRLLTLVFLLACDPGKSSHSYDSCDGNPFSADGCEDGACAEDGLSATVYPIWKARFLEVHAIDEAQFDAHISVTDVSLTEGPEYVWWRVDYVFTMDWAASRQNESVQLGDYPLASDPSTEQITDAVDLAIEDAEQFQIDAVAAQADVDAAVAECASTLGATGMELDLCQLDFLNVTGTFSGDAFGDIDGQDCAEAVVDLTTAELLDCDTTPCMIE